jgi:hypothetical protein
MLIESLVFVALWQSIQSPKDAQKEKKKAANARRDARGVTGGLTGAKWGGRLGGKWGRRVGAGLGAAIGGHRGKKQGGEKEEEKQESGKQKKVTRTRLLAKEGAKALADAQLKKLAWANAADTFGLSVVAYYGIKHWRVTLTIILALFLILFMLFDDSTFDAQQQDMTPTTSDTCNPAQFTNQDAFGKTSVCTITVTYSGSAQDITITDTLLPGTEYVSSSPKGDVAQLLGAPGLHGISQTTGSSTVTWDAQKLNLPLDPVNITVTVTIRITTHQDNTTVYNAYSINPVGLSANGGGVAIPGNIPPSTNNCSGIYSYYMSITPGHQNYGDPNCSLVKKDPNGVAIINKDAILTELKTLKPSEAMGWFICVVPHESGYNANAYLGASTSGFGAYGLVQMNPTGRGNNKYDDGEVVWPLQLSNGINYNDGAGHNFAYWPTSYDPCLMSYGVTVN